MSDAFLPSRISPWKRGLAFVRQRLRGRLDSEHEQAIVRIIIVAVLVTYYATLAWLHDFSEPRFAWGARWAAGYLLVSIVYVGLIVAEPGISPARRLTACVTDFATLAVLLHWGQEAGTPLYPIYLWVTLGNGFR